MSTPVPVKITASHVNLIQDTGKQMKCLCFVLSINIAKSCPVKVPLYIICLKRVFFNGLIPSTLLTILDLDSSVLFVISSV